LDERVAYLHYWLSNLFRLCGIKGSQKGLFSSYHSLSLVIHFMQVRVISGSGVAKQACILGGIAPLAEKIQIFS
jgi:hypothetical protein